MDEINKNNENNNSKDNSNNYATHYSEKGFWAKITNHYKKAGKKLIEIALLLYYSMRDKDTPKWAKTIMLGALGYFILPVDIIPDFVPIAGFADDIAMLTVAVASVAIHIKEEHKNKAKDIINVINNFFNKK